MMPIGSVIRKKRLALDMTLEELAEATDSSKSYIYEIERGKYPDISFRKVIAIGLALNIPVNILAAEFIKKEQ